MNFFEQQARAKRNSGRLVLLMGLAVCSLIAITTLAAMFLLPFVTETSDVLMDGGAMARLDLSQVAGIALVVCAVVLLGGLYKSLQLRQGGSAVAELLGGRLINLDPQSADEKKILNVVEEMAIASGTPVPPVYVLEDEAINAFAAGLTPRNAVIGVTRGCIQQLSRDELQGVVAHEFSHIFHGDMRLNTRLVALLHGILLIGLIGELLLRGSSQLGTATRSSKKGDGGALAILAFGGVLMLIGYAGTFFGNLIKAAVSRQREFLADASAVQFTRNPLGIGGALKKIGGHAQGSQVQASHAAEFSHMFFGQGISTAFGSLMATHPPLDERIRRVEPGWDGAFVVTAGEDSQPQAREPRAADEALNRLAGAVVALDAASRPEAGDALQIVDEAIGAIGEPDLRHLAYARRTLGELDAQLNEAAHSPYAARALMFGLLLSADATVRATQLAVLQDREAATCPSLIGLQDKLLSLQPRFRLPLIELALPTLKQLSKTQAAQFKDSLVALIRADQQVSLREWAFYRILRHNLEAPVQAASQQELQHLPKQVALLLSMLAYAGHNNDQQAYDAFLSARAQLPFAALLLVDAAELTIESLDTAMTTLAQLNPLHKPRLLKALARCIEHDGQINVDEAELFRAVADALDCPMPPLLLSVEHPTTHFQTEPMQAS
ncbi:MAG: M48 family metallopeptidase [Pseudomonadota bacterium]